MKRRSILRAKDLAKSFQSPQKIDLFKEISLELHAGETLAIMGPSGVGKSTLLHILGTLEKPSSGTLLIAGHEPSSETRKKHVGFIFQSFHLLEDFTALQNILMPAQIARESTGPKSAAYFRALSLLKRVGLSDRANFPVKLLSGGEKQRVAIARALMNDPLIILADEPTGNLDQATSREIHELLISTVKELDKGLIIVTHDESLAKLCDSTLILKEGQLS